MERRNAGGRFLVFSFNFGLVTVSSQEKCDKISASFGSPSHDTSQIPSHFLFSIARRDVTVHEFDSTVLRQNESSGRTPIPIHASGGAPSVAGLLLRHGPLGVQCLGNAALYQQPVSRADVPVVATL